MSTALTTRVDALPALATPPRLSGSLSHCVDRLTDGDNPYRSHVVVGERDAVEARQRLAQMDQMCRSAPKAMIAEWCKCIVPHLPRAPGSAVEFDRVVEGIFIACNDLPYAVWTSQTVAEALKVLTWWPAPAKLREVLLPFATPLWRLRNGLKVAVDTAERSVPPVEAEPITDQAKSHVAAVVKAFVAERLFNNPQHAEAKPVTQPRHHSDAQLLAIYEQQLATGGPSAGTVARIAALRKRTSWHDAENSR